MPGKLARQSRVGIRVDIISWNQVYLGFNWSMLYLNLDPQKVTKSYRSNLVFWAAQ